MYIILPEIDFVAHCSAPSAMSLLIEEIFFRFSTRVKRTNMPVIQFIVAMLKIYVNVID
jgi:hypothetical protein